MYTSIINLRQQISYFHGILLQADDANLDFSISSHHAEENSISSQEMKGNSRKRRRKNLPQPKTSFNPIGLPSLLLIITLLTDPLLAILSDETLQFLPPPPSCTLTIRTPLGLNSIFTGPGMNLSKLHEKEEGGEEIFVITWICEEGRPWLF